MTQNETIEILRILKATYPEYYKNLNKNDANALINLWSQMFEHVDVKDVLRALKAFISNDIKGFPPKPGHINEHIRKLKQEEELTEMEAWNRIEKAVRNSAYNSEIEFSKLPKLLQDIVGSPYNLKDWSVLPIGEFQTVIQSNFMRSYKNKMQQVNYYKSLSKDLLQPDNAKQKSINDKIE